MPVASLPVETMIEIEPSGLTVFGEFWSLKRVQPSGFSTSRSVRTASLHAAMGGKKDAKASEGKCGEGKCGEGKCGAAPAKAGGNDAKAGEGKCGEGKCGGSL